MNSRIVFSFNYRIKNFGFAILVVSLLLVTPIASGSGIGLDIEFGSLYQNIATSTFIDNGTYFLSAFVCPGTGTAAIGFIQSDRAGDTVGSISVSIDSDGNISSPNTTGVTHGILGKFPFDPRDVNLRDLYYYRIYLKFDYKYEPRREHTAAIVLSNGNPINSGYAVWFDGIQLEKAVEYQDKPTAYHPRGTIHSPNMKIDLSGKRRYYEW